MRVGITLKSFWGHFRHMRVTWGLPWGAFWHGADPGSPWGVLGSLWNHFGSMCGSYYRATGSLLNDFGNIGCHSHCTWLTGAPLHNCAWCPRHCLFLLPFVFSGELDRSGIKPRGFLARVVHHHPPYPCQQLRYHAASAPQA